MFLSSYPDKTTPRIVISSVIAGNTAISKSNIIYDESTIPVTKFPISFSKKNCEIKEKKVIIGWHTKANNIINSASLK